MDTNKDLEVQNEEVGTSKTYEKEEVQNDIEVQNEEVELFLGFRACTYYMSLLGWLEREWSAS